MWLHRPRVISGLNGDEEKDSEDEEKKLLVTNDEWDEQLCICIQCKSFVGLGACVKLFYTNILFVTLLINSG